MNKDNWKRTFYFYKKPDSPFYTDGIQGENNRYPIYWWNANYVCETIVNEETLPIIFVEVYKDIKEWIQDLEPQDISNSVHKYRLFLYWDSFNYNFYGCTLAEAKNKIDEIYNHINNINGFYYLNLMGDDFHLWIRVNEVKKLEGDTLTYQLKESLIQNFSISVFTREKVEALIKHIDFYSL